MPDARITQKQRKKIIDRANGHCEYCLCPAHFSTQSFSVEHIIPRSKDGPTRLENLALACQGCNNHKYTKIEATDPVTGVTAPLYHPRKHNWLDHFVWSEDYLYIRGLTQTGRATVAALGLNRQGVVNLRRILLLAGEHPPKRK